MKSENITALPDLLADIAVAAVRHAGRTALIVGDDSYTYREMMAWTQRIRAALGRVEGDVIGIVARNTVEAYVSILAVLFAGKTYVILHPAYPEARNRQIARQAGIVALLYAASDGEVLPTDAGVERICTTALPVGESETPDAPAVSAAYAYIIFTSGSTGEPKGVPISRHNLNAFYAAYGRLGWQLDETDRMLQMFELTFDVSVVSFLYPLTLGAAVYTVPEEGFKYLNVLDTLDAHRITFAAIAPSVLRLARSWFGELRLPQLKYLVVTAEATDVRLLADFRPCIPNATVVNLYGPTEATIYCTSYIVPAERAKHHNGMAAIGRPFDGMTAVIADEAGQLLSDGVTGELWLSGPQVMDGYWNAPEKSAAVLLQHTDGRCYYRTGDLCYRDADGDIIYCGRRDSQVKVQGFRIELGEIEYRVKQFYHDACHAVVLPLYDADGECELYLVVEKAEYDDEEIRRLRLWLGEQLPPYMVPKQFRFLYPFPLNASNKTDRKKIIQWIQK